MRFQETAIQGAYLVELEKLSDERGYFARTWCRREFAAHGLNPDLVQCSTSFNRAKFTLRGMHYQAEPHGEDKLVRCTRGSVYDVIIDVREDSPSFRGYHAEELTADNGKMLFIPKGVAHGFLTLADDSEVFYQMSEFYVPGAGCGVRWNDPAFGVEWPFEVRVISDRDRAYPDYLAMGADNK
jgi:dTDP-4-dehydrorhamnose 3,5-epimerase